MHFRTANVQHCPNLGAQCRTALAAPQSRGELPFYYRPGVMRLILSQAEMQERADAHAMFRAVGSANDFASEKVQPEPYDIPYRSLVPQGI